MIFNPIVETLLASTRLLEDLQKEIHVAQDGVSGRSNGGRERWNCHRRTRPRRSQWGALSLGAGALRNAGDAPSVSPIPFAPAAGTDERTARYEREWIAWYEPT